jgi:recombination protein RecR
MAHRHETQAYPEPVQRLIDELARLPGIGQRSAERMAFYLLKSPSEDALKLAQAITDVKQRVGHCRICYNLSDTDPCTICSNPRRDASTVLVVEQPKDLISLEQTGMFQGVYHVLVGRIDPLADVHPESLTVADLLRRVDEPKHNARGEKITEVILGMNPDLEGDSTTLYLAEALNSRDVKVSKLARGIPAGSQLEYASKAVLAEAIQGRMNLRDRT